MDNYLYSMYGNPRNGIIIYRVDKDQEYAKSSDYGTTYTSITSDKIPEVTLNRLTTAHTKRWNPSSTYKKSTKRTTPKNTDDTGITKETFINHVLRIYGPFVEYNSEIDHLCIVTYDSTNTKILKPFNYITLIELANNYHYYGNLPGVGL